MKNEFSISPLTGTIYYGNARDKKDVTDEVIAAVFYWFELKIKESGEGDEMRLTYPSSNHVLQMREKGREKNDPN